MDQVTTPIERLFCKLYNIKKGATMKKLFFVGGYTVIFVVLGFIATFIYQLVTLKHEPRCFQCNTICRAIDFIIPSAVAGPYIELGLFHNPEPAFVFDTSLQRENGVIVSDTFEIHRASSLLGHAALGWDWQLTKNFSLDAQYRHQSDPHHTGRYDLESKKMLGVVGRYRFK